MGAWIEINKQDWKKIGEFGSLLSWERGLKYRNGGNNMKRKMSLLSWERGLKYGVWSTIQQEIVSLLSWERGLKFLIGQQRIV